MEAHPPQMDVSWAPNVPAGTWAEASLPVGFSLARPRSRDVGEAAAAELDVALRTWPRASCTSFRTRFDGESAGVPGDDGKNFVFFHDDAWPTDLIPGVVAQTVVSFDAQGRIHDADIHLNSHDFRFSLDAAPGTQDLRSVLVHEIGHALGLGHTNVSRATMTVAGSGLRWRSLEMDDVMGVCALYPGTGTPGCDALACPQDFRCVAGACQRTGERANVCSPCERVQDACEGAGDDARCIDYPGGRACGRACIDDDTCGAGFRCKPTTEAGDKQCVADDACGLSAPPDAGLADAMPDAGSSSPPSTSGSGSGCRAAPGTSSSPFVLLAVLVALALKRRGRSSRSSL